MLISIYQMGNPLLPDYRLVSNIRRTLVGNDIVDHSGVVGASPVGAAPTTSSFSILTHGFNELGKDNCGPRRETFKFWNSARLVRDLTVVIFVEQKGSQCDRNKEVQNTYLS